MRCSRWAYYAAILVGVLILVALFLPPITSSGPPGRRFQSANNLKGIAITMLNYESANGTFPPRAIFDKQGKPLLSWRVTTAANLCVSNVYQEFNRHEPWDGEHNKKLIADLPTSVAYRNPSSKASPGTTTYLAVCGKGLMFEGTEGRKISDIRDGPANTIMVVEADDEQAVPWAKPKDWEYDPDDPLAGLGNAHPGGFNAAFADGSVRFLSKNIDPQAFHAMLTIAGGEPINPE